MLNQIWTALFSHDTVFSRGRSFAARVSGFLSDTDAEEPGLFRELWEYLSDKYFSVHFNEYDYQHFDFSSGAIVSARGVILALCLGIIIAAAISLFQKRTLGDFVRALCRNECTSPEKAKTFAELGIKRNPAVKADLRRGTSLRRVVRCVEEDAYRNAQKEKYDALCESGDKKLLKKWKDFPYSYDFETDHFYIPEELSYGADIQFDKRGTSPMTFLFTVVACVFLAAFLCFLLPEILQFTDNFLGLFDA